MIDGIKRNATIYVGYSIVKKTDSTINKDDDIVVCLPGAKIEHVAERVQRIIGRGNGGTLLVHIGTNNTDKEGTTAIVKKYGNVRKKRKEARVGHMILSGVLPVFGTRHSRRMAANGMVQQLCREEEVGFVHFVGHICGERRNVLEIWSAS